MGLGRRVRGAGLRGLGIAGSEVLGATRRTAGRVGGQLDENTPKGHGGGAGGPGHWLSLHREGAVFQWRPPVGRQPQELGDLGGPLARPGWKVLGARSLSCDPPLPQPETVTVAG